MWVLFFYTHTKKSFNRNIKPGEQKETEAWPGALLQSTAAAWAPSLFGSYMISRQIQLAHPAHLETRM